MAQVSWMQRLVGVVINLFSQLGGRVFRRVDKRKHPAGCRCAVCVGLANMERPRFFAGQLLTEAELNSEQQYVIAKNRLHNRYLHGWGVVCGLEVVCNDCPGFLTIKSGYALDPCGNDIVVPTDQQFDLLKRINECRDATRRRNDCDPMRIDDDPNCRDIEQEWCVTLVYLEQQTRPTMALRNESATSCACGGNGNGNCGCGGQSRASASKSGGYVGQGVSTMATATTRSMTNTQTAACEPTRIFEGFQIDARRAGEGCCDDTNVLQETMIGRIVACVAELGAFMTARVSAKSRVAIAGTMLARDQANATYTTTDQYRGYCEFYQAVRALYLENPMNVRCATVEMFKQLDCTPPSQNDTTGTYGDRIKFSAYTVGAALLQYVLDCVCMALLPPCPSNPEDDRIVLAQVTVLGDKIIRICNASCRHYAGAYPSFSYWISILPLIGQAVKAICCREDLARAYSPIVNDVWNWIERLDPDGQIRDNFAAGNFALPRSYLERLSSLSAVPSLTNLVDALRPRGVNLATLHATPIRDASERLDKAGIQYTVQQVESDAEMPVLRSLVENPFADRGENMVMYTRGGRVLGFARATTARAAPATEARAVEREGDVDALRAELATLREQVNSLRQGQTQKSGAARRAPK